MLSALSMALRQSLPSLSFLRRFVTHHFSPTFLSEPLSKEVGAAVYLKPEIYSITGSYKDRLAASAIQSALKNGARKVVVASTGNQGLAVAAAAKSAGIPTVVVTTKDLPPYYKLALEDLGAEINMVSDMESRIKRFEEHIKDGYYPLSVNPDERAIKTQPGVEGYEDIATEIVEVLEDVPSLIILPTCYGDGCTGILQGFRKVKEKFDGRIPKFLLVRAKIPEGDNAISIVTNRTTPQIEALQSEVQAESLFLSNDEFLLAQQRARLLNLNLELAAAGPLFALTTIKKMNTNMPPNYSIVLLLTAKDREVE